MTNHIKKMLSHLVSQNLIGTVMKLKRQKYVCKNCQSCSTTEAFFVKENCFIVEQVKLEIIELLSKTISYTLMSDLCSVSI
ncbi:hypothetical protein P7H62_04590 [Vagococcus carniphilus]|uniref:hypothetical protein n=1 Tax=Vagococcus carniphilus TaxID=218144 RepID=UPI00288D2172|nr:hypothetical protein [Vagococcus carniphilus]MDT2830983.1 hypothetical protein [Vagococcus carniphilus]MDT2838120.1 hypothetical protein [Vagococcus carniphilus]MDT2853719.1 hypothetical protein [Vagococcus carniphilus]